MPRKRRMAKGRSKGRIVIKFRKLSLPPIRTIAFRIGQAAIISAIFLIPLLISTQHQNAFIFPKYIGLIIAVVISGTAFVICFSSGKRHNLVQSRIINVIILLLFSYILSAIFSESPIVSMFGSREMWHLGLIGMTLFTILPLVTANLFSNDVSARLILWAFVILGTLLSTLYLYTILIVQIPQEDSLLYAMTVSSLDVLAAILGITSSLSAGMIFMYNRPNMKSLFVILSLLQILYTQIVLYDPSRNLNPQMNTPVSPIRKLI